MFGGSGYESDGQLCAIRGKDYVEKRRNVMRQLREAKGHLWGAARDAEAMDWDDQAKYLDDVYKQVEALHLALQKNTPQEKAEIRRKRLERAPGAIRAKA